MQGVLGYDRDRDRYFYRVLPFVESDKSRVSRLQGSRQILENQGVEIEKYEKESGKGLSAEGWVKGNEALYHVKLKVDETGYLSEGSCTCKWIQKHGLKRGPCKHLLSLRFSLAD
mgnify:FL=1